LSQSPVIEVKQTASPLQANVQGHRAAVNNIDFTIEHCPPLRCNGVLCCVFDVPGS